MQSTHLLNFYADTPLERNRQFSFRVYSRLNAINRLKHFEAKGWKIRAAFYCNRETCSNERIA